MVALTLLAWRLTAEPLSSGADQPAAPAVVVVAAVEFEITGRTTAAALRAVVGLEVGAVYRSREALLADVERRAQDLRNRRQFQEVRARLEPSSALATDNAERLTVVFEIEDAPSTLITPFYLFNSNSGHNAYAVFFFDNVGGSLTGLRVITAYASRNWIDPFSWDAQVLWRKARALGREWDLRLRQRFETIERADPFGTLELAYTHFTSEGSVGTDFPLPAGLRYRLEPRGVFRYGYRTLVNLRGEAVPGATSAWGVRHGLQAGTVDWKGNIREGWSARLLNEFDLLPDDTSARGGGSDALNGNGALGFPGVHASLTLEGARYGRLPAFGAGWSVLGSITHFLNGDRLVLGQVVRGVLDNRIFGRTLLRVNSQVMLPVVRAPRFGELQFAPFADAAVAMKGRTPLSANDLFVGVGVEWLYYPAFLRGIIARFSFGIDLRDPPDLPWNLRRYEVVVNDGLHF